LETVSSFRLSSFEGSLNDLSILIAGTALQNHIEATGESL
jgi:hypothetical protein